jgi:hypothetical protein
MHRGITAVGPAGAVPGSPTVDSSPRRWQPVPLRPALPLRVTACPPNWLRAAMTFAGESSCREANRLKSAAVIAAAARRARSRLHRPPPLARVLYISARRRQLGILIKRPVQQIEQPRPDDRPSRQDLKTAGVVHDIRRGEQFVSSA